MNFARAFSIVSLNTMISRVFGFLRDVLLAGILGTSLISDAFFIALKLPNVFRRIFGEGALNIAFLPIYTVVQKNENEKQAEAFASLTLSNLVVVLIPLCLICMIFMPWILTLIAPGYSDDPDQQARTILFSRITFPYLFFISLTSLFGSVLNAHKKFMAFSFAPVFFNLCLIFGLFVAHIFHLHSRIGEILSFSLILSGLVQCGFLYYWVCKERIEIRLTWPKITVKIKRLIKLMIPTIIGAFALQGQMFIDVFFTSFLVSGSLSYLYYADRLAQLPLGLIGAAMGTVLLPFLSRAIAAGDEEKAKNYFSKSILASLMLALPAAIALMIIPDIILTVLFKRGAFTEHSVIATSHALMAYAIGLPAIMLTKCLINVFYAHQNTILPTTILIFVLCLNVFFSYHLIPLFNHVGIALATGITSWVSMLSLAFFAKRKYGFKIDFYNFIQIIKLVIVNIIIGVLLYVMKSQLSNLHLNYFPSGFMILSVMIGSVLILYIILILGFKIYTIRQLKAIF